MKKSYLFLLVGLATLKGFSQTVPVAAAPANDYNVSLYGFVRSDYIFDNRKSAMAREDQLNLYPLDVLKDVNGKDANAVSQSNFLAVTSRLGVKVKGPDVWGAKISGTIEGDFYATVEANVGSFRLRHGYINMDWKKTSLTLGQTWYPTFIPEVFPGVANFNTGIMFNPFGWATQVKLKQALSKNVSISITAFKEREFSVAGTVGNAASINSILPTLNGKLEYKGKNVLLGGGAEYKSVEPNTIFSNVVTTNKLNSTSIFAYGKYSNDAISIKAYGISGGNMNNLVMIGGYTAFTSGTNQTFSATRTTAYWIDIASNGKTIAPGFFFGTTQNDGAATAASALANVVGRGLSSTRSIDNVWRASGRIDFKKNKFRVSPELEYTNATWGDTNLFGKAVANKTSVSNFRTMISCVYNF
ncbi:DcaP family trimeric outer membrane transporter [Flavobacterium sp.]|uniref:DcaP family trimeric outer membrane transporter n=1 Tax=Flavobacterium sp. TaxID=239 RepID=UPI0037B29291